LTKPATPARPLAPSSSNRPPPPNLHPRPNHSANAQLPWAFCINKKARAVGAGGAVAARASPPPPISIARAGQPTRQLAGRPGCEEKTPPKRGLDRSVAINGHPDRACQGLVSDPVSGSVSGAVGSLLSPW
jgi:hypothetical protein